MKKKAIFMILACIIFVGQFQQYEVQAYDVVQTLNVSNLTIVSYSKSWATTEKLNSLVQELLANVHGEELALLSYIYIYPDSPYKVSALYHPSMSTISGKVTLNSGCYIELFDGDTKNTVASIARTLSHEYGHHFMTYYLAKKENLKPSQWLSSKYYKIRKLEDFFAVTYIGQEQASYNHEWDIVEIIAEDYVQFYGSPLSKKSIDFYDVNERLANNLDKYSYNYDTYNLLPQENLDLQLAPDAPGLLDYFERLTGLRPDKRPKSITLYEPWLDYIEPVVDKYNQYRFSWSKGVGEIKSYTLLIYPISNNDFPIPIVTKNFDEPLYGDAGSTIDVILKKGILENHEGRYGIRLLVEDANGFIHSSDEREIYITSAMNKPKQFSDVSQSHWAYDSVMYGYMRGYIKGYTDGTFRPNTSISRDEYITMILRTIKGIDFPQVNSSYWFEKNGYLAQANALKFNIENWSTTELKKSISREEMAEILRVALEYQGYIGSSDIYLSAYSSKLTDLSSSDYQESIQLMEYFGVINGYGDETFRPFLNAKRSEVMKILRIYDLILEEVI